jgi:nucleotide-binding universal stress UspA family protein
VLDEETRTEDHEYLVATQALLLREGAPRVEILEIAGPTGPALAEAATNLNADLLVVATHGRGAVKRFWLGSVADYLIRHLSIPVLLVHPGQMGGWGPEQSLRRVLVALDLSADAEAILEPVSAMAQLTGGHITLVHVLQPVIELPAPGAPFLAPTSGTLIVDRAMAQQHLDEVADGLRLRGLSVNTRLLSGTAVPEILEELAQDRYDVLALTTHGRGGLSRLLLGSVAEKLIRRAMKPVLVVRPLATPKEDL